MGSASGSAAIVVGYLEERSGLWADTSFRAKMLDHEDQPLSIPSKEVFRVHRPVI